MNKKPNVGGQAVIEGVMMRGLYSYPYMVNALFNRHYPGPHGFEFSRRRAAYGNFSGIYRGNFFDE